MPSASLSDRSFIHVGGADAQSFLHNLITTDVNGLPTGEARPGALLTPQGKILFDFLIWRTGEGFTLECPSGIADALLKRLTMYKLRAAVSLSATAGGVSLLWGEEADSAQGILDAAFAKVGLRVIRQPETEAFDSREAYDRLRIEAGIVTAPQDYALQDAFPHDVLMDMNGGLSFRKGCYVGQEVVSRMQHRGTARRRVVQVVADDALPETGTELTADGKPIGQLGTVVGNRALAIVRIDRAGDAMANAVPILAGAVTVRLALPGWTGLSFPTNADGTES
ncbi:folate-binding protein YgfZ [Rhizobium sp. FKY42]|uniref:CAF17-like 4Fe-4S cluster assembly/insertion protein YgfZ n=1 Tax=Rhizobium sp. FKY42 TaxID=2562310 RepID=UPI0010BFD9A1|nr:folate-binding protein YgfZ [Rhizobium sp. FKY42]